MFEFKFKDADAGYRPEVENTVECAVDLVRQYAGRVVIITGAGLSSHALPTFRSNSNQGLWDVLATPILAKSHFYEDPLPAWKLHANVRNLQVTGSLKPSCAHCVIHELVHEGYVSHVLTQNVDGLHNFRGDESRVLEMHGSVNDYGECESCQALRLVDHLSILREGIIPRCEVCGGVLKPPVAFFEDSVPKQIRQAAYRCLDSCDVIFLVGTHCAVDPVLSLAETAKRNGSIIIEVNTETTHATPFVDVVLRGTSDEIFKEIGHLMFPSMNFDTPDATEQFLSE